MNIEITNNALEKIFDLLVEEKNKNLKLRIFVQGGGCSGFQYGFQFEELINDDDIVFKRKHLDNDIEFIVDYLSLQYLEGATVDYKESLMSSQFVINNPNATTTCGCGASFSV